MQQRFLKACIDGSLDEVKEFIANATNEEISCLLNSNILIPFRWAAGNGHTETLKYLWAICPDNLKPEMLKFDEFYAFFHAAGNGHTETLKYLWSICPDDLKVKMLKADDFSPFYWAAGNGHTETLKYLWSICPDDLKVEMLKATNFSVFWWAAANGHTETLKYLWAICPDDLKVEMLKADEFYAFFLAAENGHTETLKYLWSICPDDLKVKMLKAWYLYAFRKAAENGHFHTLEYLLSICDEKLREEALSKLRDEDKNIAIKMVAQREEILGNNPTFDIDSFNSLFKKITNNKKFARVLLTCKKPESGTFLPAELFYEVASFVIGENVHKPVINHVLEAVTITIGEGHDMRYREFLLQARKNKFKLNEESDNFTHNDLGIGCSIL